MELNVKLDIKRNRSFLKLTSPNINLRSEETKAPDSKKSTNLKKRESCDGYETQEAEFIVTIIAVCIFTLGDSSSSIIMVCLGQQLTNFKTLY